MRKKGFGHLKTILFTIKTSKHVGLNSPFGELTLEQVTFCPKNVCQALGKIILVFTYGSGCAAGGPSISTDLMPFYLVDLGPEFMVNFAGTWCMKHTGNYGCLVCPSEDSVGCNCRVCWQKPLNASTGMAHSWMRSSMFGRDMLLVKTLLEMTVHVEIPSSIMTNFPMNNILSFATKNKSQLIQRGSFM